MKQEANIMTSYRFVRGRKNYSCETCEGAIPKGTIHLHASGRFLGQWRNDRYCGKCDLEIINSLIDKVKTPLLKKHAELTNKEDS